MLVKLKRAFYRNYWALLQKSRYRDFLFENFAKYMSYPMVIHLELTNNCNLNCEMCERKYIWEKRGKGYMEFSIFKKVIDEAANMGIPWIQLNRFGESTLHPKLPEFISYAKASDIKHTYLISNGTVLTDKLSRRIIDSGLDHIAFSFDGAKKSTYESIRKGANYNEAKKNIENFIKIRDERGKTKPIIQLNSILTKKTENEIGNVIDMWEEQVDSINIQNFKKKYKVPNLSSRKKRKARKRVCKSPAKKLIVFWDGAVVPCCYDSFGHLAVGDVKKSSIEEIWKGDKINHIRQKLYHKDLKELFCKECDMAWK